MGRTWCCSTTPRIVATSGAGHSPYEGPATGEVYFDQELLFTNTARPGSVADFSSWQLLGLGTLFVCGGMYVEWRRRRRRCRRK